MTIEIQDGTYEILSVGNTNFAMDSFGATDKSGANVVIHSVNHTPAQRWSVTNYNNGVQITNTLSGRCLDLANNQVKDNTNIRQWEDNNSHAQRWDIVNSGTAMTYGSKTYDIYYIKSHGTDFCVDVSKKQYFDKNNIMLHSDNGGTNQQWIFIPIESFREIGTYNIVTAMDPSMNLDIPNCSTATYTNLQIWPKNTTNAQTWYTLINDDQTITIVGTKSGKAIDNYLGAGSGGRAIIHPINFTTAQCFFAERKGTITYDGQTVPTYMLEIQAGEGAKPACLDVRGAVDKASTQVFFYEENGNANQRWAFIPAAGQTDQIPTPAALQSLDDNIGNDRTVARYSFSCNWLNYQMRVRFKTKTAAGWSSWSCWKSAFDAIGGNNGWGNAWMANLTYSKTSNDLKTVDVPIPEEYRVNGSTITAMTMQAELRGFGQISQRASNGQVYQYTGCSNSAAVETTLYWKPTVKVASAKLCGTGLIVGYTSDLNDGGCNVTVGYAGHTVTKTGMYGGSGEIEIQCDQLIEIPTGTVTCTAKIEHYISSDTATGQVAVTDSSNRKTISMTQDETYYGTHLITLTGVTKNDNTHIYLVSEGTPVTAHIKTQDSTTVYEAVSPLKTKIHALVWVKKADGTWDDQTIVLKPITDHAYCWTFNGGGCVLDFGSDRVGATQEDSITRKVENYEIVSREFNSYRLHKTRERTLTVSGAFVDGVPKHGTIEWLNNLLNAGHATFRNGRGEILPVVVTGISKPINHNGWTEVKVTQYQESR